MLLWAGELSHLMHALQRVMHSHVTVMHASNGQSVKMFVFEPLILSKRSTRMIQATYRVRASHVLKQAAAHAWNPLALRFTFDVRWSLHLILVYKASRMQLLQPLRPCITLEHVQSNIPF
jgi:hypothetical protein